MAVILPFPTPEPATAMRQPSKQMAPDAQGHMPEQADAWGALMARAQDGDKLAYHALLHDITPYLRAVARRYLGRSEDAEDAVQEILMVVHDIRHTYEPGRPFKPWLGTIATRRCIDLLRRRARRVEHELVDGDALDRVQDSSAGPEEATVRLQNAKTVRAAVAGLSPRQQEAIRLVHLRDMSLDEAAKDSRQTVGALKVACHRALKSLQHTLGKGADRHG
ncbi:RNA polymerase sigma factor [Aerolutibacter daejeonensis]|uniref:RNA polymerase sigma factor n=1 Tax=Aerolutibacter daejeonensis TaxID=346181 RepID=UPI00068A5434|nr:sigma-70 family RNA polymerase sigma factor [Lysobacter daejeonensis]